MSDSEEEDYPSVQRSAGEPSITRLEREQVSSADDEDADTALNTGKPADMGTRSGVAPETRDNDEEEQDEEAEDDEDQEQDDEEDDDDEEEDERDVRGKKRKIKKRKINRFLDVEAEVDDEEEDMDDEDIDAEQIEAGFIDNDAGDLNDDNNNAIHRRIENVNRDLLRDDAKAIARRFKRTYRRDNEYDGSANFTNRKANMPSPSDPRLWQVRCKPLSERPAINAIMSKCISKMERGEPMNIFSAFQRDSLPGVIFVEAHKSQHVHEALEGVLNVYLNEQRNPGGNANLVGQASVKSIAPVDLADMVALLTMKKAAPEIKVGMWVRLARGDVYLGDLAQIKQVIPDGLNVEIVLVPRIDYNPDAMKKTGTKRKKGPNPNAIRPPQRLFNKLDVLDVFGRGSVVTRGGRDIFQGEEYTDKGLLTMELQIDHLKTADVNPTLEEIARFADDADPDTAKKVGINMNLDEIAEQAKRQAGAHILPGDHVDVVEGELFGLRGLVDSVSGDVVNLTVFAGQVNEGQLVEASAKSCRKVFKVGDHVKVMSGKNAGETGLVLTIEENVVTFFSDMAQKEVQAFSRDLREAAESGVTNNRVGSLRLHDLVNIDAQTAGVIFQTEREAFRVVDQNGTVRVMQPHQISSVKTEQEVRRATGLDRNDKEFRVGDMMKEAEGEGRRGNVLHVHRGIFTFLHNREVPENEGVFVVRNKNLIPHDARRGHADGPDLTKLNPAVAANNQIGAVPEKVNLRRLVNVHVVVVQGTHKGLKGVVKDTVGSKLRVELGTNNKVVTFEIPQLKRKDPKTGITSALIEHAGPTYSMTPQVSANPYGIASPGGFPGGMTPGPSYGIGMTPNPYAQGGRTPAGPAYASTPFLGGATPFGAGGGATPFMGGGGRTPAGYAMGGQTPAGGYGGATPYGGYGGQQQVGRATNPYGSSTTSAGGYAR